MKISNNIRHILMFIVFAFGALNAQPARAATTVMVNSIADPGGDGICDAAECTLREAVALAGTGDTIDLTGVTGTITLLSGPITIAQNLVVTGPGADQLTVSGNNSARVFYILGSTNLTVSISGLTISNGFAPTLGGGGIYSKAILTVDRVAFEHNITTASGGAIYTPFHSYTTTITNSTFYDNRAANGGAIYNFSPFVISNGTFAENSATTSGGGIYAQSTLTVYNSVFSGNSATTSVAGIYNRVGVLTLKNSILANGAAAEDCKNTATYGGTTTIKTPIVANNLIKNNAANATYACGVPTVTADPILSVLGAYGGSTPTFGLLPGSPAINAGDDATCLPADQRGSARFGVCDIGAFESQGFALTISGGNNQSANINTAFINPLAVSITANNIDEPVNGGQVAFSAPIGGASVSITGSPATISAGGASVTAAANDTAGSYIVSASASGSSVNFNLTNNIPAPDTQIDSNPPNPTNNPNATFTFSSPDITATFECSLNGLLFSACSSGQNYSSLGDGAHTFEVRAKDTLGTVDPTPAAYTWVVDTTPPDTQIISFPPDPSLAPDATFSFASPDGTAVFECSLDGAAFTACASPQAYSGLVQGSHTFQVRAKDPVGNTDPTPASYTWMVYTIITANFTSTAANDGWILESTENSNAGSTLDTTAATFRLGDSVPRQQYRSMLSFNTSSLPDTATITGITVSIKRQSITGGGDPFTIFNGLIVETKSGFFGGAAGLQATDFQAAANNSQGPFLPTPVGALYSVNLANSAFPYINKLSTFQSGLTQFRLRFSLDDNNNAVANYISFFSGNTATAADRPVLQIQYYIP